MCLNLTTLQRTCRTLRYVMVYASIFGVCGNSLAATVVNGTVSGTLEQLSLELSITPDTADAGKAANLYMAASVGNQLFFASGSPTNPSWISYQTGAFPNLGTATLPAASSTDSSTPSGGTRPTLPSGSSGISMAALTSINVSTLAGARIYAGYGSDDQDLMTGKYQHSYTVPAAQYLNLAYASVSSAQMMDLYLPAGTGPFPLVMNIHGGAFRGGNKSMLDTPIQAALLSAGYAVATINYRLSSEALFPAALQDAKAALRFLRANATEYRLDSDRFVAFGQSAGGNIASMLGATSGVATTKTRGLVLDDPKLGNTNKSSAVQAVIDWFGPTDFTQMDAQSTAQGCVNFDQHNPATSPESAYMGVTVGDSANNTIVQESNPITYLTRSTPPMYLIKGSADCTVPAGQSRLLFDALQANGVTSSLKVFENAGHGTPSTTWLAPTTIQSMLDFLNTHIRR